jgi:hypothetical protein
MRIGRSGQDGEDGCARAGSAAARANAPSRAEKRSRFMFYE